MAFIAAWRLQLKTENGVQMSPISKNFVVTGYNLHQFLFAGRLAQVRFADAIAIGVVAD